MDCLITRREKLGSRKRGEVKTELIRNKSKKQTEGEIKGDRKTKHRKGNGEP